MNDLKLTALANLIWDKMFSSENRDKSKDEQIDMIKSILIDIGSEERKLGRIQIINHIEGTLDYLKR